MVRGATWRVVARRHVEAAALKWREWLAHGVMTIISFSFIIFLFIIIIFRLLLFYY